MLEKPKTSNPDWRWATGWSLAILTLSCLPYLIATLSAPAGWHFAGFLVNPLDGHSYMAKMQQGEAGHWLFHLTYTPEPHAGSFIFTFYLALGHIAALTGLPKILIFHLARLLASLGLLLMVYRFIARLTPHQTERHLAFILLIATAGLGWLGAIIGAFPIDLWVPEAFVSYSIYTNPHFPLAMLLMLIIFEQALPSGASQTDKFPLKPIIISSLSALALALLLPFGLLLQWAILILFTGWCYLCKRRIPSKPRLPWNQLWLTLSVVVFSAPVIAYQYWVSTTNPILSGWGAQNVTPAPPLLDFWLGYGLVGLLAISGVVWLLWKDKPQPGDWLVMIWAIGTIALIYVPFDLQRRLITGLHIPLCILAAIGLNRWLQYRHATAKTHRLLTIGVLLLGTFGLLVVWGLPLIGTTLQSPEESPTTALFFVREAEVPAFVWLKETVEPADVILASPRVGLFVPGQTGARAFYGHPFETIEATAKEAQIKAFFKGDLDQLSPAVDYIFYGPTEQALGQPDVFSTYFVVYEANGVKIYQILGD